MSSYYIHDVNGSDGPFSLDDIQQAFAKGRVTDTTMLSVDDDPAVQTLADRTSLRLKMPQFAQAKWTSPVKDQKRSKSLVLSAPKPPPRLKAKPYQRETTPNATNETIEKEDSPERQSHENKEHDDRDSESNQELAWWKNNFDGYILVQVIERRSPTVRILQDGLDTTRDVPESDIQILTSYPPLAATISNLVRLDSTEEPAVLHCLRQRYLEDLVYTHVGNILVSMNPFRGIPAQESKTAPSPHEIAAKAYELATRTGAPQSMVISGESGSGKSEMTRSCLQYFATVTDRGINLEAMLLACSPILDAFGNAKTLHNVNSSRFGKLIKLHLNDRGKIDGCSVTSYLLEKSRLSSVAAPERNFHIFYQLCANMPDEEMTKFAYLGDQESTLHDKSSLASTIEALDAFHFAKTEVDFVLAYCRGILHLGNIQLDGDCRSTLTSQASVGYAATCFGCTVEELVTTLVTRRLRIRGELMEMPLEGAQAVANRDSLAKAIYSRIFDWILRRINETMQDVHGASRSYILLVDIFGFETFEKNGFEQLCINFANEKLQELFYSVVFDEAIARYRTEGLTVPAIDHSFDSTVLFVS
ncbi:unnamed protein product [Aphanomyces euteiches]